MDSLIAFCIGCVVGVVSTAFCIIFYAVVADDDYKGDKKMTDQNYKEVYFHEYCKTCKYEKVEDIKDPCNECLGEPCNLYSHKPVKWEEKE